MSSDWDEYRETQDFLNSIEESERRLRVVERDRLMRRKAFSRAIPKRWIKEYRGAKSLDDDLLPDGTVYIPKPDSDAPF